MGVYRVICSHGLVRSKCKPCTLKYQRERMAFYRAYPYPRRVPCTHGLRFKKDCAICKPSANRKDRDKRSRANKALKTRGVVLIPFELFEPVMEILI